MRNIFIRLLIVIMVCVAASSLLADSDDNLDSVLSRSKPSREAATWLDDNLITPVLTPWESFRKTTYDNQGLDLAFAYTLIYQASNSEASPTKMAVNNLDLVGQWHLIDEPNWGKGTLGFKIRYRANIISSTSEFSRAVGSIWFTNDTSTSEDFVGINQLWWSQKFLDNLFAITIGKLEQKAFFSQNRYAGSDKTQFLSQPLARNPVMPFPGNGFGANLTITPNNNFYIVAGAGNASGSGNEFELDFLTENNLFTAFELGLTPQVSGLGKGYYRLTLGYIDETTETPSGGSLGVSFDQDIGTDLGLFLRYGIANPDLSPLYQVLSGGIVIRTPFGNEDERAGIGVSWTQPSLDMLRDEIALEAYYRSQISQHIAFTPDIQVIFNPSANPDQNLVLVGGIRMYILF